MKILAVLFCFQCLATVDPPWVVQARQLIGVGEVERAGAVKKLKAISGLPETLEKALSTPYKFFALDVISVLQIKALLNVLIEHSKGDDNGATYLCLNTLIDKETGPQIEQIYKQRIEDPRSLSAPVITILLDTLGKMGSPVSPVRLKKFLQSPSYEVRVSAIYHAGLFLKEKPSETYVDFLKAALSVSPYQARLQALSLLMEMEKAGKPLPIDYSKVCKEDKSAKVRSFCVPS